MATNYGFTQGAANSVTSVSVQSNPTCPANASSTVTAAGVKCYAVTITKDVPLYFVQGGGLSRVQRLRLADDLSHGVGGTEGRADIRLRACALGPDAKATNPAITA